MTVAMKDRSPRRWAVALELLGLSRWIGSALLLVPAIIVVAAAASGGSRFPIGLQVVLFGVAFVPFVVPPLLVHGDDVIVAVIGIAAIALLAAGGTDRVVLLLAGIAVFECAAYGPLLASLALMAGAVAAGAVAAATAPGLARASLSVGVLAMMWFAGWAFREILVHIRNLRTAEQRLGENAAAKSAGGLREKCTTSWRIR